MNNKKFSALTDIIVLLLMPFIPLLMYYFFVINYSSAKLKQLLGDDTESVLYLPYTCTDIYSHVLLEKINYEFDLLYSFFGGYPILLRPDNILVGDISEEELSEIRYKAKVCGCPYDWEIHEKRLNNVFFILYILVSTIYINLSFLSYNDIGQKQILYYILLLFVVYTVISYFYVESYAIGIEFHVFFCSLIGMIDGILAFIFYAIYYRLSRLLSKVRPAPLFQDRQPANNRTKETEL